MPAVVALVESEHRAQPGILLSEPIQLRAKLLISSGTYLAHRSYLWCREAARYATLGSGMTKQRHIRLGDRLDDDDTIVIRGGRLDPDGLRVDAERYHAIYGEYGISVFAARDATVDELAQLTPLIRFEMLTLVRAGVLRSAGPS